MKPKVCISYSSIDKDFLAEMIKIMNSLKELNLIEPWTDQNMQAGDRWDDDIKRNFREADIYLLLLSRDFINSNYIKNVEKEIIEKNAVFSQSLVIPIFIRECDFAAYAWIDQVNGLPTRKKWIGGAEEKDRDALFTEVSVLLREKISSYIESKEDVSTLFFGVTDSRRIFQERRRVFGELRGLSKKNPSWNVDFKPKDATHDTFLDLDETEFKKAIKEELNNSTFCAMILDAKDDYSVWQYQTIKEHWKAASFEKCVVFLSDNPSDIKEDAISFIDEALTPDRLIYSNGTDYKHIVELITDDFETYFTAKQKELDVAVETPGSSKQKNVVLFFDESDKRQVHKWSIKKLLDQDDDILVMNKLHAEDVEQTNRMIQSSSGVVLYYGEANMRWFNTIQMQLRKSFATNRIEHKVAFLGEPEPLLKKDMDLNTDVFLEANNEVKIIESEEQVRKDIEEFINRLKSSCDEAE